MVPVNLDRSKLIKEDLLDFTLEISLHLDIVKLDLHMCI